MQSCHKSKQMTVTLFCHCKDKASVNTVLNVASESDSKIRSEENS
jgi:hypothetical protein